MTALHPHWQPEEPAADVPVHSPAEPADAFSGKINIRPASRMPAAITGIAIMAVAMITLAGGWQALQNPLAQVGTSSQSSSLRSASGAQVLAPVEIHIGTKGFKPENVTVKPGQQIVWINDQSFPHILASSTLRDQSGAFLNTPAIFPKGKTTFTVGTKETSREHQYASTTDPTLRGTIIVDDGKTAPVSKSAAQAEPFGSLDGVPLPTGQGSAKGLSSSSKKPPVVTAGDSKFSSSVKTLTGTGGNTETTNPDHEAAAMNNAPPPLAANIPTVIVGQSADLPPVNEMNIAPLTPVVQGQPETGPEVWVAVALSAGVLLWSVRKMLLSPLK